MSHILQINNLSVSLQKKCILSEVSVSLSAGEIMGLVGPSGCGKTTLLNTISGFIEQNQGEINVADVFNCTPENIVPPEQRNIGMIFQDYALFPHLTVEANILFGIDKLAKTEQQARLKQLVELLELTDLEKRFPHQLSGGQQQRVAIARALAPQPKLLLLDEPFSNIDARLRNELMLAMRRLLKALNMTAIFVTHNKDEVFTFADKIAVMHQGTVLQTGKPAQVCQQPSSWQVADFLQLGSWIPLKQNMIEGYQTAFGALDIVTNNHTDNHTINNTTSIERTENPEKLLLLKPQNIELSTTIPANVRVDHIAVTEQGYHYLLSSLTSEKKLAFEQLSYYSEAIYEIEQTLAITIKPHEFVIFDRI